MELKRVSSSGGGRRTGRNGEGKTVVVIPAYNEARFIGSVVVQARSKADVVLVVDDGSDDNTAVVAEAAGATVVRHLINRGKGAALRRGLREAAVLNPDVVVAVDADGQHDVAELGRVARPVLEGQADIVIGSRYLEAGSEVPGHRILGHHLVNFVTNRVSGIRHVTDSQSGFRAFSPRALQAIRLRSNGFSVESEMQFIAKENGLKLVEAPITVHYQDKPKRPAVAHGLLVLNGLLPVMGHYQPLTVLGLPGMLVQALAGVCLLQIVRVYQRSGQFVLGYVLLTTLLILLGNSVMTTGITLHAVRKLLLDYFSRPGADDLDTDEHGR